MTKGPEMKSLTMAEIYKKAKDLPAVISPAIAKECWNKVWVEYRRNIQEREDAGEVTVGGITVFRGNSSRNLGDIIHEALHRKTEI